MPDKELSILQKNLRFLRKRKGLAQLKLEELTGINRHNIGAYEEGRSMPPFENLIIFSDFYGFSIDAMGRFDFSTLKKEELQALRDNKTRTDLSGKNIRILAITEDRQGRENIEFVPDKAAAGYLNEHGNPAYLQKLPKFHLPTLGNDKTHRAFEIEGDSMLPIPSGSVIVCEYVENWERDIKIGEAYIVVSQKQGIVFKRIGERRKTETSMVLNLVSDNPLFPAYDVELEPVDEIWRAKMVMNTDLSQPKTESHQPGPANNPTIESLYPVILKMQEEIIQLKNRQA
jgi:transcriptional regulator with XRE-family HTH domain